MRRQRRERYRPNGTYNGLIPRDDDTTATTATTISQKANDCTTKSLLMTTTHATATLQSRHICSGRVVFLHADRINPTTWMRVISAVVCVNDADLDRTVAVVGRQPENTIRYVAMRNV